MIVSNPSKLFANLRNSDEKAYEAIFNIYFGKTIYFISSVVRDKEVAHDLAQDIFLKLWEHREDVTVNGDPDTYMYVIAKNKGIDYLRRRKIEEGYIEDLYSLTTSAFNPESTYCAKDMLSHIDRIVEQMPRQRKEVFRMSRLLGLSYKEIAIELGIKVKTVESHLYCAIKQISGKLNHSSTKG